MNNPRKTPQDWAPNRIKGELMMLGLTLQGISEKAGFHGSAAGKALSQPWPALEKAIADALGVNPEEIWPSRYDADGKPKTRPVGRPKRQTAALNRVS